MNSFSFFTIPSALSPSFRLLIQILKAINTLNARIINSVLFVRNLAAPRGASYETNQKSHFLLWIFHFYHWLFAQLAQPSLYLPRSHIPATQTEG
jgi:hypothetical protein